MAHLSVRDLACRRGDRVLFSGVDFDLAGGQWLHVRGANGVGKSTLLRTLAGLASPANGSVNWGQDEAPRTMMLGHQAPLKRELTAQENLFFGIPGDAPTSGVTAALTRVGLKGRMHVPARFLSEGQKRRVALARLLLQPAALWLLDEPQNGLDTEGTELLGQLVEAHLASGGMAVVTSHQPLPLPPGKELCL
ncbi:MAG TPA: cytochrome c biogenesis heme-transporting ATPase CcmA [Rhodocyclaceae bacterium]|nr:cytochrome c biogenesis heme-transporting ATPase CcmA [Rhodocyclaceae bacterium]